MNKIEKLIEKLCPDGVENRKLSEVFIHYRGMSGVSNKWNENGNCVFIDYLNVYNNYAVDVNKLPYATVSKLQQNKVQKHDILCTCASEVIDECAISSVVRDDIQDNVFLDDHLFGLRLKEDVVDVDTAFVNYYMMSVKYRRDVVKTVKGVTRFFIGYDAFMRIEIPIPPLEVQQEIVKILDDMVALQESLERELGKRKVQFEEYKCKLLDFPDGINKVLLSDLFDFRNGLSKGKDFFGSGVKFISFSNVYNNHKLTDKLITSLVECNEAEIEKLGCHRGDIFITRTSETREDVGHVSTLVEDVGDCVFNGFTIKGTPKTDLLLPEYCAYCLDTEEFHKHVYRNCSFTTRASLTGTAIGTYLCPVPSLEEQKHIVEILDSFDKLCNESLPAEIEARRKQYEYYRDKLMTFKRKAV